MQKQTGITEKRKWLFRLFFCCLIILSDPARIHQRDPVFFGSECFPEHCRYIAGWPSFGTEGRPILFRGRLFFCEKTAFPKGESAQSVSFSFPGHCGHEGLSGQLLQDLRRGRHQQCSVRLANAFHHEHPVRIHAWKHQYDPDFFVLTEIRSANQPKGHGAHDYFQEIFVNVKRLTCPNCSITLTMNE